MYSTEVETWWCSKSTIIHKKRSESVHSVPPLIYINGFLYFNAALQTYNMERRIIDHKLGDHILAATDASPCQSNYMV